MPSFSTTWQKSTNSWTSVPSDSSFLCTNQRYHQELATKGKQAVELGATIELGFYLGVWGGWAATAITEVGVATAETGKALELIWTGVTPTLTAYALRGEPKVELKTLADVGATAIDKEVAAGVPVLGGFLGAYNLYKDATEIVEGPPQSYPQQGALLRDPTVHPGPCGRAALAMQPGAGGVSSSTLALPCGQATVAASTVTVPGGLGTLGGGGSDGGVPDGGSPDAGTRDAGAADAGAADAGPASDAGLDAGTGICCCRFDAVHYCGSRYDPCWNCLHVGTALGGDYLCGLSCNAPLLDQCVSTCP